MIATGSIVLKIAEYSAASDLLTQKDIRLINRARAIVTEQSRLRRAQNTAILVIHFAASG
jgi:hypothetical protein